MMSFLTYLWESEYPCAWRHMAWPRSIVRLHSRPQRPRSFWSAPRIATSGLVQRHSGFEWICKHNRLRPEPIRFFRLDSEHAQSDGKSVNRGLSLLDSARGRDSWCWPKGARPLGTRMPRTQRLRSQAMRSKELEGRDGGSMWRRRTACSRSKFESKDCILEMRRRKKKEMRRRNVVLNWNHGCFSNQIAYVNCWTRSLIYELEIRIGGYHIWIGEL